MAGSLPNSGQISLGDVQLVHNGEPDIFMSEYYGADSDVPCYGKIALSDFHGTSKLAPAVIKMDYDDATTDPYQSLNGAQMYYNVDNGDAAGTQLDLGQGNVFGGYLKTSGRHFGVPNNHFIIEILPNLEVRTPGGPGNAPIVRGDQIMKLTASAYMDQRWNLLMTTKEVSEFDSGVLAGTTHLVTKPTLWNPDQPGPYGACNCNSALGIPDVSNAEWEVIWGGNHLWAGAGTMSTTDHPVQLNVPAGKRIRFAHCCGPNWQRILRDGHISMTYMNPKVNPCA